MVDTTNTHLFAENHSQHAKLSQKAAHHDQYLAKVEAMGGMADTQSDNNLSFPEGKIHTPKCYWSGKENQRCKRNSTYFSLKQN